ncbi:MAG TPA: low-specificity L-threonine aldolase [Anaerolineaceae bacterium]|nr:low-specificity L-threonine aldolase [Anaerolineaceae bacterium]
MNIVDLRSDTVTKPTPEMREAMANAEVGDDVYGEDPNVNLLQETAAEMMGKAAGLFVPSGTMGNLIAVMVHCQRGDEAIMGDKGHTFSFEAGGISALGGVFPHTLPNQADGTLKLDDILGAIRPDDVHHPISKLIILENTQNRCGGVVLSEEYTKVVSKIAHDHDLKLHIDGARIFNAAVALKTSAKEFVKASDSVTFCLSKGLSAPVGSVLCGSREFIDKARRIRKMLGGGMRQAGILAAAGLVALENMVDRLAEDHRRAGELAHGLAKLEGIHFEMGLPQTNMVFPSLGSDVKFKAAELAKKLASEGIKVSAVADRRLRLVTHAWIDDAAVEQTLETFKKVLA